MNLYVCEPEAFDMETRKYQQLFADCNELDLLNETGVGDRLNSSRTNIEDDSKPRIKQ